MKKITLMIFVSLMSFFAYAQLPVEHFDSPWTGTPAAPPDWVVINEFGPNETWAQTIPGNTQQVPFGGTGHSAYLQKENVGPASAIPSDWLVTKAFPMVANAELRFQNRLTIVGDNGGIYRIYIAPYTSATESVEVADFTSSSDRLLNTYTELELSPLQTSWNEKVFNIPANAQWAPGTLVRIAFVMQGDDQDRWFLDDIKVAAQCAAPTNPVVTATTMETATFSWTNAGATEWEIEVVTGSGVPTGTGQTYNGTLPYVRTGLTPCTDYRFYVRNKCSDGGESSWVGPTFFRTRCLGETCEAPIVIPAGNQSVSGDTANSTDFYEGTTGTGCNSSGNYLAGNDVVYSYTPDATGNFSVTLTNTGGAAGMFIYSSCANIGVSCLNGGVASASTPVNLPAFAMTAGTTYYIVISSNGNPQTTPYTLTIQQVFCPQPTNGNATAVTGTTATLNWTPGTAGATAWQLAVQPAGSGLPTTGTNVTASNGTIVGGTTNNVPFTPATAYEFYVRESCAGGMYSIWSGPYLFTTTQVPAPLNFAQNFDSGVPGFTLGNGTQVNKWVVGSATSNSASNSLYITNDNGVSNTFNISTSSTVHAYRDLQMPATVGQLALSFDWKAFGESCCDYLKVWMVPASFTPTPGTMIDGSSGGMQIGGNMNLVSTWTNSTTILSPTGWDGDVMRLVFEWHNDGSVGSQPPAAIDNISLSVVTCPQPTALVIGSLDTTTAVVNWTAPAIVPASYDVYVTNSPTPAPTAATVPTTNVPGTTTSIALAANTFYYVWVRANCGPTDKSFWTGPLSFSTPQVPAPMDYTENFDGAAHNYTLANGAQANKWVVGGATFNSASNSLYVSDDNGTSNSYDGALISTVHAYRDILIPASVPSGQGLLQFDWKNTGNSGDYLRVWVVPITYTPTAGTAITAGASGGTKIGADLFNSATWATSNNVVTIPAAWNNIPRRIVFEWRNNDFTENNPPAAVDNVSFKVVTCPAPTALVLGSLTTTSATINWTPPASAPGSYDYYYSTTTTPPTDATLPSGNVPGATATIPGLTDSTNYNVWVRSNCGSPAGNSFWVGPLNFNTPQIPAPMPYTQNFDGAGNPAYTLNNGTQPNKWVVGGATFNSPANSLYISNDNGVTNNYSDGVQSTVHAYRDIQLPASIPTNQILFQYDWKALGESCCDYLKVWVVPVTFTPTPGTMITAGASGGIQLGGNLNNNNTWTTVNNVLDTSGWPAGSIRRIIFEWRNDGSVGPSPAAAVDNINFSVITCSAPSALALTAIDAANATFTWTASTPPAASYDYYLTTSPVAPVAGTVPTGNVTGTSLTLSGLPPSTNYYLWIRSNCGAVDGNSFWVGGINFDTPQIPVTLPYVQNFDGTGNSGFTFISGDQPNKWVVGSATFSSPANSLYISNDNGVTNSYNSNEFTVAHAYRDVVIPAGATDLDFAFHWKNVGEMNDYVKVWRVPLSYNPVAGTEITASADRVLITPDELFGSANWQNASYVVPVGTVQNTTQRFVFEWTNNTWNNDSGVTPAAIDNIDIKLLTCPKPINPDASEIGMTSATLNWTEVGTATAWEVYVVEVGEPLPSSETVGTPAPTNPFVYNVNLTPGTQYQYFVRSICGPNDVSRWCGPFFFNTNVCEVVDQCPVNFVLTDSGDNGWENNKMTVTQNGIPVLVLGPQITDGGPTTVTAMLCKGIPYEVFWDNTNWPVNPSGNAPEELGLQIVNPYNGQTLFQRLAGSPSTQQGTKLFTGIASCADITCPQPTDLVSESVVNEPNTTELAWTPGGTETAWEVIVQPQDAGFPSSTTTAEIITVEDNPRHVLGGLTPAVLYEYYVRAICSDTDQSFWSGPLRFSIFTPPACADVAVYDVDLEIIPPNTEYVLCPGDELCVDFDANYYQIGETTSYEVTSIPFELPFPTTGGTQMDITEDDRWAPRVDLPFEFCFYGDVYNAAQVGSNGVITFNATNPAYSYCPWAYNQTIPDTGFPVLNAIYGVYQDLDVRYRADATDSFQSDFAHPEINYQVIGNYPCRALVVNFNEIGQFSSTCGTDPTIGSQTTQVVLYEISNIIEVYVKDRVSCTTWNNGNGLIGLQNNDGTLAVTPPNRNTGAWSTHNEAWRFTPNGPSTAVFEWLKNDVFYSSNEVINVCVQSTEPLTTMTARATYSLCNGDTVVRDSDFTIRIESPIILAEDPSDLTKCGNGEDVTFDLNDALVTVMPDLTGHVFTFYTNEADAIAGTNAIPDTFITNAPATTIWLRVMREDYPCFITSSFEVTIVNVPPVFTVSPDVSICAGTSTTITVTPGDYVEGEATYSWTLNGTPLPDTTGSITATAAGDYVVTVNKNGCVGTATTVVTVVAIPVADAPADVVACDTYELPALSANNNYYTGTGGTGTALSAGDDLGIGVHTLYVYAVSPDLAACTAENSFTVTVNETPQVAEIEDVQACDSYQLTAPTVGNYFTGAGGTGTQLADDYVVTSTQTIYLYAETASTPNCSTEDSFIVTITPTPVADAPVNVIACDSYTLPALSPGNNYFASADPTTAPMNVNTVISSNQTVYVIAVSPENPNCYAFNSFDIQIVETPEFSLGGPYVTCVPSNITVSVSPANFNVADATFAWTVNGAPAGDNSSSIVGTEFGTYEVTVTVGTCSHVESIEVTQDTDLIALALIDNCVDNVYYLEVTDVDGSFNIDTATYSWSGPKNFESTDRTIEPVELGEYVVTVTTADGCISIDSFEVESTMCDIPRGISPDGDGRNDEFNLTALGVRKISIFNRYGQEVYSKTDYKKEWFGQENNGNELPTGTYYYMVERNNGETRTGWVYINRQD